MERIRFILPQVKIFPDERPDACARRLSPVFAKHGTADKTVTALCEDKVTAVRHRCSDCGRSGAARRESTEADRRSGCADGRRSRGRSDCRPLREPPARRLRRLHIAHERMGRDVQEAGRNARKKQARRTRGQVARDRRGRDCGSREGRESGRGRGGRTPRRAKFWGWTFRSSAIRTDSLTGFGIS